MTKVLQRGMRGYADALAHFSVQMHVLTEERRLELITAKEFSQRSRDLWRNCFVVDDGKREKA